METTFYFIDFYYFDSRELHPFVSFETRKMVCYSDADLPFLKAECRKYCRRIARNDLGVKPSHVVYRLSVVSESQYNESTYSLL